MAEPFRMEYLNMDVNLNKIMDGINMTTKAGFGNMTEGCNMDIMDGLYVTRRNGMMKEVMVEDGAGALSSVSPSSPSSLSSSSLSSLVSSPSLFSAHTDWVTASSFRVKWRKTRKEELERKEMKRKVLERKKVERKEMERKKFERKQMERKEMERKEMERKETERKEVIRKEMEKEETERKEQERKNKEVLEMLEKDGTRGGPENLLFRDMPLFKLGGVIMEEANRICEILKETNNHQDNKGVTRCAGRIMLATVHFKVRFRGMEKHFKKVEGENVLLKERMERMISGSSSSTVTDLDQRMGREFPPLPGRLSCGMSTEKSDDQMVGKESVGFRDGRKTGIVDKDGNISVKEKERKEMKGKEMKRKDIERKEIGRKEMERKETERKEIERKEMERKEKEKEMKRKEIERKEIGRKEIERKKTERKEMERMEGSNITPISPFLIGEDFPLPPLLQRVTRKVIARSDGDWMPPVVQPPPPMVNRGFKGVETDGEACKGVILEDGVLSASETEWKLVGGRRKRKDPFPPLPPIRKELFGASDANMEVVNHRTGRRSPSWQQPENRPRPTSSSSVLIVGRTKGFAYADALRNARQHIDLEALGIGMTHVRKAANGGYLIEVLEEDSRRKAEILATRLREVLKDSAVVSCPSGKKRELRITGFDESVRVDEIVRVLSSFGGCPEADVRVGPIRTLHNGLGVTRVQLPVAAAAKLVGIESVRLGWMMARVELLKTRPLQCYRCWEYGHTQNMCHSVEDRRNACFKCGQSGHLVSVCQNRAHCPFCHEAGEEATHRLGGPLCGMQMGKPRLITSLTMGSA